MTPELIGFAQEALFQAGALEVYTVPAGMKKSRPGTLLTCMCRLEDREAMVGLLHFFNIFVLYSFFALFQI